jgi:hypothetical protein
MPLLPIQPQTTGLARGTLRAALTTLAGLLLVTCTDNPVAPGRGGVGQIRVYPTFDAFARIAPLAIDRVRLVVVRPQSDTLKDVSKPFPANQNSVQITAADVQLNSTSEDLLVTIELYSGTTLLFSGTQTYKVVAGVTPPASSIPVTYGGPGSNLDSLDLTPRDTVVQFNALVPYRLSGFAAGLPLAQYYVSWSASAGTIDGAGVFHAPAVRDTILIRATSPNGIEDSTNIIVTAGPAIVVKTGGDLQSGLAGGRLPAPLQVRVDGTDGKPLQGVDVTFAVATGGGSVDNTTVTTDVNGLASTGATLGPTAPQQTFTATAPGLNTVTFTETAVSGIQWAGTADNNWNNAANWIPAQVPGLSDDVTIPVTATLPVVSTTANLNSLTIAGGATVTLNGTFTFNVAGNLIATGSLLVSGGAPTVQLSGAGKTLSGSVASATVTGTIALAGPTTVSGNVAVSGGSAQLDIGINALSVGGNLSTGSGGRLKMTTGGGGISVTGSASFAGGDETGLLTAGAISIGGDFSQSNSGSATSYAPSGTHATGFVGAAATHTVNFGSPGSGAAGSHFMGLDIGTTGTVSLATDAFADGLFTSTPVATPPTLGTTGATHKLTAQSVSVTGLVVNQATFTIGGGTIVAFNSVQFTNMPTTVAQLTVNNPGAATPFNFTSLTFATTPVAPNGFYMDVSDPNGATGGVLTINMVAATPATPGTFLKTDGVAIVNWPPTTPILAWNGTTSTNWSTAANWTPAQVPSAADTVLIPAGTPNSPTVTASCSAAALTVNTGATLNLGTINCAVGGSVFADGTITGTGAVAIAAPAQIRGNFPSLILSGLITQVAAVTATGNVTVTGTAGSYVIGGQPLTMGGNLNVQSGARLVMLNPLDVVTVTGNAIFSGGFELDSLNAGVLSIGGNLTQNTGTTGDTYHTSGTHQTIFTGNNPTISFATPGDVPGTSHFQQFTWSGTGTLTLATDVYAHVSLTTPSATPVTISGGGHLLQVGNYVGNGPITFSNTRLGLNETTGGPLTLNNATFSGLASTAIQLTVVHPGTGGPFTFNNLAFAVAPTGAGKYISATDADGATPTPLTINVTNSSPASATAAQIAQANGAVINWPPATPVRTWGGTISTDWFLSGNWVGGVAPGTTDNALIPSGTPNAPSIGSSTSINDLTVQSGAVLSLNDINLNVTGNLDASGSIAGCCGDFIALSGGTLRGIFAEVVLSVNPGAVVTLNGATTLSNSSVQVEGELIINGNALTIGQGSFSTLNGTGLLTMIDPSDIVQVLGNATFNGGSETGHLMQGVLQVLGNFTQLGTATSFAAGGGHTTQLSWSGVGATPTVSFADPVNSRFQNLSVSTTTLVTLASNVTVAGQLLSLTGATPDTIRAGAPGVILTAGGATVTGLVLDAVPLVLSGGPVSSFGGVTFLNQSPTVTQLTVNNTGAGGPFTFTGLSFLTPPTGAGLYLKATDLDGATNGNLTINMVGANPAAPSPSLFQAVSPAVINWPAAAPGITWTGGAGNTNWYNAGNWSTGAVPGASDSVVIVASTTVPVLEASVGVGAVNIASGSLTVNGQGLIVARTLATTGSGTFVMINAADFVTVNGNAIFNGGSTNGLLTAGRLQVGGNFTQLASASNQSFAASCTHTTELTASSPTISFATPGPDPQSHFGALFGTTTNTFQLASAVSACVLNGNSGEGFNGAIKGGGTAALTVQSLTHFGITFDGAQLVFEDPTGISGGLNGITFVNQPATVDQLTIRHPGPQFSLSGITYTFLTTGATGSYLNLVDLDAPTTPLVVTVFDNNPGNGPLFTKTDGVATAIWPGTPIIWGGALSDSWDDPANWLGGVAPTATDDAQIPSGTSFSPRVTGTRQVKNLIILSNATLTINDATLQVSGSVSSSGTITESGGGVLSLTGTGQTVIGSLGTVSVATGASYSLAGPASADVSMDVAGSLALNGFPFTVNGDFSTAGAGTLTMTNPADQLIVGGNATFTGGSTNGLLTDGIMFVNGNFSQTGASSFSATGSHRVILNGATLQNVSVPNGQFANLDANSPGGMIAQSDLFLTGSLSSPAGPMNLNGHRVIVGGSFQTSGTGTLIMQNPNGFDSLFVTGSVSFAGGSTAGLLTNGVLRAGGSFQQLSTFSTQSFAPSGLHRTELGVGGSIAFQSPGAGAAGSHFASLDVTAASGGAAFLSDAFVDSVLIASVGAVAPKISGSGNLLTAKQWQIQGLQVDHVQMVLNEGTTGLAQTFNGVSFQGFPTTTNTETLITVTAAGGALAPRTLTFNTTTLQTTLGAGGFYVKVASSNGLGLNLIMAGSNDPTGGISRSQATPPATIQYQ